MNDRLTNYRDARTGQFTTAADAAARPAETVAETVPTRHEAPDVAELRRLAEAVTPGPWSLTDGDPAMSGQHWTIRRQGVPGIRIAGFTYGFNGEASYIAAANPAAVLGLLDDADALRAELAHMTAARDNARAEVERLSAQAEAVRALHASSGDEESQGERPDGSYGYIAPYCTGCEASDEYAVAWTCPTIRALGGEQS